MTQLRIAEAAALLGISDDTLRRWIEAESIPTAKDDSNRTTISGVDVARLAARSAAPEDASGMARSARNQFAGIVTRVIADGVMAQVEMQCGPHRVVSLMSAEAAAELRLTVGTVATAVVKATMVVIETPAAKA